MHKYSPPLFWTLGAGCVRCGGVVTALMNNYAIRSFGSLLSLLLWVYCSISPPSGWTVSPQDDFESRVKNKVHRTGAGSGLQVVCLTPLSEQVTESLTSSSCEKEFMTCLHPEVEVFRWLSQDGETPLHQNPKPSTRSITANWSSRLCDLFALRQSFTWDEQVLKKPKKTQHRTGSLFIPEQTQNITLL